MNIYTIYKATNTINKKCYIGFATNFIRRKNIHKKRFEMYDTYFYRALRKYGWESFEWSILYQSKDKNHTKNEMETHFITEYRAFVGFKDCVGYNMTLGGDGSHGFIHSKQTKKEMSLQRKGKNVGPKKIVSCKLYDPNGILHEITNLREFCQEKGFRYGGMLSLLKSKVRKRNYGWMKYEEGMTYQEILNTFYESKEKYRLWKFYKDDILFEIYDLHKYSKENNLKYGSMKSIFSKPTYIYNNHLMYMEGMSFEERMDQIKTEKEKNELIRRSKITGRKKKGL